ncbi:MAG: hypothetical protein PHW34_10340 [Hespellia sp.]|nr:hypothetical protein [Hespellia sp.]
MKQNFKRKLLAVILSVATVISPITNVYAQEEQASSQQQESPIQENEKAPAITSPEGLTAVVGQTLKEVILPEGWTWEDDTITITNADEQYPARFSADDTTYDYTDVEGYNAEGHYVEALLSVALSTEPIAHASASETTVTTDAEFKAAFADSSISTIMINGTFTTSYANITSDKKIMIQAGANLTYNTSSPLYANIEIQENGTLTINAYDYSTKVHIYGTVSNNGTLAVTGRGAIYNHSQLENNGTFTSTSAKDIYSDYGCLTGDGSTPSTLKINIVKDTSALPVVSIPETITVGDTVIPTVTNLIEGVDISKVFTYEWRNSSGIVSKDSSYKVTSSMSLIKVILSKKNPYVMLTSTGTKGSIDSNDSSAKPKEIQTVYVDGASGDDTDLGELETKPVKTIAQAIQNVSNGGTIVLLSDCNYTSNTGAYAPYLDKTLTIKSEASTPCNLNMNHSAGTLYGTWNIQNSNTLTFENINFTGNTVYFSGHPSSAKAASLVLKGVNTDKIAAISNFGNVQVENATLTTTINSSTNLSINNVTLAGTFYTDVFNASGTNTIVCPANASSNSIIKSSAVIESPITLNVASVTRGKKLIELPSESTIDSSSFTLGDTTDNTYTLKKRSLYAGTYIQIVQNITTGANMHVAYEPVVGQAVMDSPKSGPRYMGITFDDSAVKSYVNATEGFWSGYSDAVNKIWQVGDQPEFVVTFGVGEDSNLCFDGSYDFSKLTVYSWKDLTNTGDSSYIRENISPAVIEVKEGQGVSNDGRTCTVTLVYPEVKKLENVVTITTKSLDKVYDKTAVSNPEIEEKGGTNQVAFTWYEKEKDSWILIPSAPSTTGIYRVVASVAEDDIYNSAESAPLEFVISQAVPSYTVPTDLTAMYGQTLADITLPKGFTFADTSKSVGDVGKQTFKLTYTPEDTKNYKTVSDIDVDITVLAKENSDKSETATTTTQNTKTTGVKTGDHTLAGLWIAILALAAGVIGIIVKKRRSKR